MNCTSMENLDSGPEFLDVVTVAIDADLQPQWHFRTSKKKYAKNVPSINTNDFLLSVKEVKDPNLSPNSVLILIDVLIVYKYFLIRLLVFCLIQTGR